jgi:uncharacterized protein YndB with AHSA1/START domain
MTENNIKMIEVEVAVNIPVVKAWKYFTAPGHITKWYFASDDWHTPSAVNDLKSGGKFSFRMEAKDKSFGFDFAGIYSKVQPPELMEYIIADGRKVTVTFTASGNQTVVKEVFEPEGTNTPERQKEGWQAILDNYKKYAEGNLETCF